MRKFLIPAAIFASSLVAAAPAAAQWAPPGNAYGHNYQGQGQGRQLSARLIQLRREIRQLDLRNVIGHREAIRLDAEARSIEYRLRQLRYNGVNRGERYQIERQIARLEQQIHFRASNGNRRFGYNNGHDNDHSNNGAYNYGAERSHDRDRDGRDDRYEDDRGREHDGRRGNRDNDNDNDHDDDD